jgi:hypothetical protein
MKKYPLRIFSLILYRALQTLKVCFAIVNRRLIGKTFRVSLLKKWMATNSLLALLFLLAASGCAPVECTNCTNVLFVGNSYTATNNLPNVFLNLANSGGQSVQTGLVGKGDMTLSDHAQSTNFQNTLQKSSWNYVIIQEQGEIPAVEQSRNIYLYPAARAVVASVRSAGASPIFFQTWARRDGMPANGLDGFESMQYEIDLGYSGIADELSVPIAPVGDAWFNALSQNPDLQLWQADGIRPTQQGTYLAACVFYAVIFKASPEGLSYTSNLPAEIASQLQTIAAQSVLP